MILKRSPYSSRIKSLLGGLVFFLIFSIVFPTSFLTNFQSTDYKIYFDLDHDSYDDFKDLTDLFFNDKNESISTDHSPKKIRNLIISLRSIHAKDITVPPPKF